MSEVPFTPPEFQAPNFNCPHCRAFAHQYWFETVAQGKGHNGAFRNDSLIQSRCNHCRKICYWLEGKILYPQSRTAPLPNADLSSKTKAIYEEAANIAPESPRGAAALLRLAIQMLCAEIGGKGKNINEDIQDLVGKGLPVQVQQALDVVRVIGNNAVHPGEINLDDQPDTVAVLFTLVNIIADRMITQPKQVEILYGNLPDSVRKKIAKRDEATAPQKDA